MASVSLRSVHKKFGPITVLQSIDLDIEDGEFVVLVGPSGCGKSTLLRSIAGLETINGGEIHIGERQVNHVAPKDRDIAMVFQSYALYPHMDVRRNMGFSLNLRKSPTRMVVERVSAASTKLGLNSLLDRLPKQLSGGQRQRVAMGRAIVRNPQVFLFDEPLSNLDAKLRATMRTEIKALHQSLKTTAIYVTHDQVEAMTMANRIVVMSDGVIQQVGAPLELYDRPANIFVAGFIGSPTMNFFDAVIDGKQAGLADGSLLALPASAAVTEGQKVVIGIRPEHLHFTDTGIPGTVVVVEPLGMSTQVTLDAARERVTLLALERPVLAPGDRKHLTARPQDIHVFDRASGLRVN
ncbi:ABC transporter ATP-binding protein [Taklimakanibacter lacteus]|uniref:ABC transporter ATP-binding protein n=1 Tax=Taklimakanibacter lacteus TaxID=2268456 RepID=UPI000E66863B